MTVASCPPSFSLPEHEILSRCDRVHVRLPQSHRGTEKTADLPPTRRPRSERGSIRRRGPANQAHRAAADGSRERTASNFRRLVPGNRLRPTAPRCGAPSNRPLLRSVSVSLWPISLVGPHYRCAASAGKANTTIVGEPGFLSFQKFDGLPDATAMYCRPPVE